MGARRSSRLERILRVAALAFPMAQDAIDNARFRDKGTDAHAGTAGAKQRVRLEDFPDKTRPRATGFPGEVRIILILARLGAGIGVAGFRAGLSDSAPVRIGP
jgi:hypothetical protein